MDNPSMHPTQHNVNSAPKAGGSPSAPGEAQSTPPSINSTVKTERADLTRSASPSAASDTAASTLLSAPEPPAALFEDTPETAYLYALGQVRDIERQMAAETCYYRSGDRCLVTVGEVVQAILDGVLEVADAD